MKRGTGVLAAVLMLVCIFHPGVQKAAAAVADEVELVVTSAAYGLEITEPTLTEEDGMGTFRAKVSFSNHAVGERIHVAVAFYLENGRMMECWSGVHTLAEGAEIVLTGVLSEYDRVGVYFFEEDSLTPIRPAVLRTLDGQAQVTNADLDTLRREIENEILAQKQDMTRLELEVEQLREELETLKNLGGTEAACGTQLLASEYGILPGSVDMEKMNSLLARAEAENKTIRFDDGIYEFPDTIHIGSNTSVAGSTNTIFKLSAESVATTLMSVGEGVDNVYISHLMLQGALNDTPAVEGDKCGLRVEGAARVNIENVEIAGFDRYGFYAARMSSNSNGEFYKMLQITNCRFYNNYYGMCLGPRCEYTQTLNCVFGANHVGCLNQGGNNSYVSCIFNVNHIGFQMDSMGLSNPAHGGCNACAFNHNTKAIVVNDCEIGWIFNGCQIFYGSVELNECSGVVFNSSIFGSCVLNSTNAERKNVNLISDSFFQTDSAAILSGNDGSVYVTDCLPDYVPQTEEETSEEYSWTQLVYTQPATAASGASVDAYFAPISHQIPVGASVDILDIAICGATSQGQNVEDVDVWIGNAQTGEITEHLVQGERMETTYSTRLKKYVLRVAIGKSYEYPTFVAVEAERTGGRGIAYGRSDEAINHFNGVGLTVGEILTANNTYIPEIAVYSKNGTG